MSGKVSENLSPNEGKIKEGLEAIGIEIAPESPAYIREMMDHTQRFLLQLDGVQGDQYAQDQITVPSYWSGYDIEEPNIPRFALISISAAGYTISRMDPEAQIYAFRALQEQIGRKPRVLSRETPEEQLIELLVTELYGPCMDVVYGVITSRLDTLHNIPDGDFGVPTEFYALFERVFPFTNVESLQKLGEQNDQIDFARKLLLLYAAVIIPGCIGTINLMYRVYGREFQDAFKGILQRVYPHHDFSAGGELPDDEHALFEMVTKIVNGTELAQLQKTNAKFGTILRLIANSSQGLRTVLNLSLGMASERQRAV